MQRVAHPRVEAPTRSAGTTGTVSTTTSSCAADKRWAARALANRPANAVTMLVSDDENAGAAADLRRRFSHRGGDCPHPVFALLWRRGSGRTCWRQLLLVRSAGHLLHGRVGHDHRDRMPRRGSHPRGDRWSRRAGNRRHRDRSRIADPRPPARRPHEHRTSRPAHTRRTARPVRSRPTDGSVAPPAGANGRLRRVVRRASCQPITIIEISIGAPGSNACGNGVVRGACGSDPDFRTYRAWAVRSRSMRGTSDPPSSHWTFGRRAPPTDDNDGGSAAASRRADGCADDPCRRVIHHRGHRRGVNRASRSELRRLRTDLRSRTIDARDEAAGRFDRVVRGRTTGRGARRERPRAQ